MTNSVRAAAAVGLSLLGAAALVAPTAAQSQDPNAARASTAAAAAPKPAAPVTIGSLDMDAVFQGYKKVKVLSDKFKAEATARQHELMELAKKGQEVAKALEKLTPGSPDAKKLEAQVTELEAKGQALQKQSQSEFAQREAEILAELHKDIFQVVGGVAKQRGLAYVVKVSKEEVSATDPNSVGMAMQRVVVYADPALDITPQVVQYLNFYFDKANPEAAKAASAPAAPTPAASAPAVKPAR